MPHLESGCADPEVVFCEPSTKPLPVNYRVEGDDYYDEGEYAKRDLKSSSAELRSADARRLANAVFMPGFHARRAVGLYAIALLVLMLMFVSLVVLLWRLLCRIFTEHPKLHPLQQLIILIMCANPVPINMIGLQ